MRKKKKPRCFVYVPVSTNEGQQDARNQVHNCHEYARQLGLKVTDVITVEVWSQKSRKARTLDDLFDQMHINDTLITSEISRLGRSTSEIFRVVNEQIKGKINLHCIKENFVLLKDDPQLIRPSP
jgi:DNA invertase Pin-like site-specific DNA recombinase